MYSHYDRIIKYVGFEPIHYAINNMLYHLLMFLANLIMSFY